MWIYRILTALLAASPFLMLYLSGSSVLWLTPPMGEMAEKNPFYVSGYDRYIGGIF